MKKSHTSMMLWLFIRLFLFEQALVYTANRANEVFRKFFKRCSRFDSCFRCSLFRIIGVSADSAYVFFHINSSLFIIDYISAGSKSSGP